MTALAVKSVPVSGSPLLSHESCFLPGLRLRSLALLSELTCSLFQRVPRVLNLQGSVSIQATRSVLEEAIASQAEHVMSVGSRVTSLAIRRALEKEGEGLLLAKRGDRVNMSVF